MRCGVERGVNLSDAEGIDNRRPDVANAGDDHDVAVHQPQQLAGRRARALSVPPERRLAFGRSDLPDVAYPRAALENLAVTQKGSLDTLDNRAKLLGEDLPRPRLSAGRDIGCTKLVVEGLHTEPEFRRIAGSAGSAGDLGDDNGSVAGMDVWAGGHFARDRGCGRMLVAG